MSHRYLLNDSAVLEVGGFVDIGDVFSDHDAPAAYGGEWCIDKLELGATKLASPTTRHLESSGNPYELKIKDLTLSM